MQWNINSVFKTPQPKLLCPGISCDSWCFFVCLKVSSCLSVGLFSYLLLWKKEIVWENVCPFRLYTDLMLQTASHHKLQHTHSFRRTTKQGSTFCPIQWSSLVANRNVDYDASQIMHKLTGWLCCAVKPVKTLAERQNYCSCMIIADAHTCVCFGPLHNRPARVPLSLLIWL